MNVTNPAPLISWFVLVTLVALGAILSSFPPSVARSRPSTVPVTVILPTCNSSKPEIVLVLGSKTIEEVPILRIPVTLVSPTTTRSSLKVTPEPTGSMWSLVDVTIPTLIPRVEVFPSPKVSSSVSEPPIPPVELIV